MRLTQLRLKRSVQSSRILFFWICILVLTSACSDHSDFRLGIVTLSVSGQLTVEVDVEVAQPFVIVRKFNRTLIENSAGGYLYRVSATIVYPENGQYKVDMAAEVDRVELTFLGRYHVPVTYRFKRTLGVGEYIYHARLKKDPAWRESYHLLVKPNLTEYITEDRFKMRQSDQLFLGQWMDKTEAEF